MHHNSNQPWLHAHHSDWMSDPKWTANHISLSLLLPFDWVSVFALCCRTWRKQWLCFDRQWSVSTVCSQISIYRRHRNDLHSCLNCRNCICFSQWSSMHALLCVSCPSNVFTSGSEITPQIFFCVKNAVYCMRLTFALFLHHVCVQRTAHTHIHMAEETRERDYLVVYSTFFSAPAHGLRCKFVPTTKHKRLSIIFFCVILPTHG